MSQEQLEKMRTDLNLNEIKTRLLAIPGGIHTIQRDMVLAKEVVDRGEQHFKEHEAELMFEISQETNGDKDKPKPKFSNDTMRKAELTRRLKGDSVYQDIFKKTQEARLGIQNDELDIDRLRNDFRVQMAFKDLAVAEMNLLGA